MAQISLPDWKYGDAGRTRSFWLNLLLRVRSLPGVTGAGTTHALPVTDDTLTTVFEVENRVPASSNESLSANFRKVTPGYFETLKIPLVAGRFFIDLDDELRPPVAVVSREMARRFWPNQDPVGKRLRRRRKSGNPWITIVGVAGDVQDGVPGAKLGHTFYIPLMQDPKGMMRSSHLAASSPGSMAVTCS